MTRPVLESPDLADIGSFNAAAAALAPAIDDYLAGNRETLLSAYRCGTVASEVAELPSTGAGLAEVLAELATAIRFGCRIGASGATCYINTAATTSSAAAQTAVAVAGGQRYYLHAFNALESTGLRWLAELCGLPASSSGVFTSGGSSANLVALGAARQAAFERMGVDASADGLAHSVRTRVYAARFAHRTIHRAAAVLGLGRDSVVEVPDDGCGHIVPGALDDMLAQDRRAGVLPIAVVGVAGSTDSGAVDPLEELAEVARRHGTWLHVDGAYGLIAAASPTLRPLFRGMEHADSWTVDPHKWLATGLGVGAVYVRDPEVHRRAFLEGHATYLEGSFDPDGELVAQFDSFGGDWADLGVELSAPPRGVLVWAVLREIGRAGVVDRVERHVGFARHLADRARHEPRLELLAVPELSITCFRYRFVDRDPNRANAMLLRRLRRETPFAPSSTVVNGALAIRSCYINPRTTLTDVDGLVDAVLRIGAQME